MNKIQPDKGVDSIKPSSIKGNVSPSEKSKKRHVEIEEIDAAIGKMSRAINAASYELMLLIREFDERAGWLKWGYDSALPWLRWRCDLSTNAACDKLRIAHALRDLPLLSEAFSTGDLSYTKLGSCFFVNAMAKRFHIVVIGLMIRLRLMASLTGQR